MNIFFFLEKTIVSKKEKKEKKKEIENIHIQQ